MYRMKLLSFGFQPQGLWAEWLETFAGGGLAGSENRCFNRNVYQQALLPSFLPSPPSHALSRVRALAACVCVCVGEGEK